MTFSSMKFGTKVPFYREDDIRYLSRRNVILIMMGNFILIIIRCLLSS